MKKSRTLPLLILLALLGTFAIAAQDTVDLRLWNVARELKEPAPADRLAQLADRRNKVAQQVGERGLLILQSGELRNYANDVDYPYRQENNLYYLTGINQTGVVLVLIPGAKTTREILFIPRRDAWRETWTGHMASNEEASARSGVKAVWDIALLGAFLSTISPRSSTIVSDLWAVSTPAEDVVKSWRNDFRTLVDAAAIDRGELFVLQAAERDSREFRQEQILAARFSQVATGLNVRNAAPIFASVRLRKSPWELSLLQQAVDISSEAFHRVFALAAPGMKEYEVQAEFEYTFRRRHADNWGYPCIVGSGENATTLHYVTNQDELSDGSLLLMDCAAEYDHYSADITRTLPINGKFTKEQADIYRIVYEASQESTKVVRPGNVIGRRQDAVISPTSVHGRAVEVVKEGLFRLGLITSKTNEEYRVWFMHGTSHWIGMNVHDVGDYATPLEPNMVLTIEPGIYIRADALDVLPKTAENERFARAVRPAFEKYKGIGVRIEDDVLVTTGEPRVMSAAIPSRLEEVEATMTRLRQELRRKGFPPVASR
jgi:Xaa-Pro aminopeptidase